MIVIEFSIGWLFVKLYVWYIFSLIYFFGNVLGKVDFRWFGVLVKDRGNYYVVFVIV